MADESYVEEIETWKLLIGGFIMAFGEVELYTYKLWRDIFPGTEVRNEFKPRIDKLVGKLRGSNLELNGAPCPIELLIQARALYDKRNTVAHSPMQVQVYEHTESKEIFTELAISSEKNDDYITDQELAELQNQTNVIVSGLFEFYTKGKVNA